jgi:hypothetical protein
MKKKEKLRKLSGDIREGLRKIALSSEYPVLERLFKVEEQNIVIQSFKVNSSDPDIVRKKAHLEGRVYELRKILRTFQDVMREKEDEG